MAVIVRLVVDVPEASESPWLDTLDRWVESMREQGVPVIGGEAVGLTERRDYTPPLEEPTGP